MTMAAGKWQQPMAYNDGDHDDDGGNCYDDCRKGGGSGGVKIEPAAAAVATAGDTTIN